MWNNKSPECLLRLCLLKRSEWLEEGQVDRSRSSAVGGVRTVLVGVWEPAVGERIKVNIDAACFNELNITSIGGVLRKAARHVVGALTRCLPYFVEANLAEALCLIEVLSWIEDLGINGTVIEMDSLVSVGAVNRPEEDQSYFGVLISDCHALLSSLDAVSVTYIPRNANVLAHKLARAASYL